MAKDFRPSVTIEKMAAYLDNNLPSEEMSELDSIIMGDDNLSDILSEIDMIDTDSQTILPTQEFIIEQLILPTVAPVGFNSDISNNQITNNLMDTHVEENNVSFKGYVSPEVQQQHVDTCAVKCQEIIMNALGYDVTEDQLLQEAQENGWFNEGTSMEDIGKLMASHGMNVVQVAHGTLDDLIAQTAAGHQVIVAVDSGELWNPGIAEMAEDILFECPDHALIFSGIEVDPLTNERMVLLTDPGTGDVLKEYNVDQFMDAWNDGDNFFVALA